MISHWGSRSYFDHNRINLPHVDLWPRFVFKFIKKLFIIRGLRTNETKCEEMIITTVTPCPHYPNGLGVKNLVQKTGFLDVLFES